MVGLKPTVEAFFKTLFMMAAVIVASQSLGLTIAASTKTLRTAQAVSPMIMVLLIMFGGFYRQVNSIPFFLQPLEAFSFLQYGFIGIVRVQFAGEKFTCELETYCLPTGEDVIESMGVAGESDAYWPQFGKVIALIVLFRTLAYFALRFLHVKKLRFD
mmetsp:Transcript_32494/g.97939  ORF Transcript_32494/g.97939 Transcript_32494/m.97939 type:complete len:158 (-) Transcript_32494:58-531(-)